MGKGHKTLSITDVLTTKRSKNTSTTVAPAKSTSKLVAATVPSSNKPSTIAAILPLVNDHSSDSEEDNDLSVCAVSVPVKSKHLIWHCQIHGLTNDFPVKTCAVEEVVRSDSNEESCEEEVVRSNEESREEEVGRSECSDEI